MNFKEKLKEIDNLILPENSAFNHFNNLVGSSTDRVSPYKNSLLKSTISAKKPIKQTSQYIRNFYDAKFRERMGRDYLAS